MNHLPSIGKFASAVVAAGFTAHVLKVQSTAQKAIMPLDKKREQAMCRAIKQIEVTPTSEK